MSRPRLTPAMRRALLVLDEAGQARYSNRTARGATTPEGVELGPSVYWQAADRLKAAGLVTVGRQWVRLTDEGRAVILELVHQLELEL